MHLCIAPLSRFYYPETRRFINAFYYYDYYLGQDNLLTILFSADNLTLQCRDYDTYRYTVIMKLGLWQQKLVSDSSPKLSLSL